MSWHCCFAGIGAVTKLVGFVYGMVKRVTVHSLPGQHCCCEKQC